MILGVALLCLFMFPIFLNASRQPKAADKKWWHFEHEGIMDRIHDDERNVTCWRMSPQSLTCIPDSHLK